MIAKNQYAVISKGGKLYQIKAGVVTIFNDMRGYSVFLAF